MFQAPRGWRGWKLALDVLTSARDVFRPTDGRHTLESSVRLKDARDKAVQRFRQDGLIIISRAQTPVVAPS